MYMACTLKISKVSMGHLHVPPIISHVVCNTCILLYRISPGGGGKGIGYSLTLDLQVRAAPKPVVFQPLRSEIGHRFCHLA